MATDDVLATISGLLPAAVPTTALPRSAGSPTQRDSFARRAGPDVSIVSQGGVTQVYALFVVDPKSHQVRIEVVDGEGRLIRACPPPTTAEMLATMASFRRP